MEQKASFAFFVCTAAIDEEPFSPSMSDPCAQDQTIVSSFSPWDLHSLSVCICDLEQKGLLMALVKGLLSLVHNVMADLMI